MQYVLILIALTKKDVENKAQGQFKVLLGVKLKWTRGQLLQQQWLLFNPQKNFQVTLDRIMHPARPKAGHRQRRWTGEAGRGE